MSEFLSPEWIEEINERLAKAHVEDPLFSDGQIVRVVFEMTAGPTDRAHAMTFTLAPTGVSLASGDHLAADLLIRLNWEDAEQLANGTLDGGLALREGRLKIRGDVNALIPFGNWMVAAQSVVIDCSTEQDPLTGRTPRLR